MKLLTTLLVTTVILAPMASQASERNGSVYMETGRYASLPTASPSEVLGSSGPVDRFTQGFKSLTPDFTSEKDPNDPSGLYFTPHASTLGYGLDIGMRSKYLGVRGSYNKGKSDFDFAAEGGEFNMSGNMESYGAMVELYPTGGNFRLSGGLRMNDLSYDLSGTLPDGYSRGGTSFIGSGDTQVDGTIRYTDPAKVATIGYHGEITPNIFLSADIGAMFLTGLDVDLSSSGGASSDPRFQQELNDIEDTISKFKIYPIAKIGLTIKF